MSCETKTEIRRLGIGKSIVHRKNCILCRSLLAYRHSTNHRVIAHFEFLKNLWILVALGNVLNKFEKSRPDLFVYLCVWVCVHACMHVQGDNWSFWTCTHMWVCVRAFVCVCVCVCVRVHMNEMKSSQRKKNTNDNSCFLIAELSDQGQIGQSKYWSLERQKV